jgi:hypothetical protein
MIRPPPRPRRPTKDRPPVRTSAGRRGRLPAPGSLLAQPEHFAGARLTLEEAETSLKAAADRLALPRSPWTDATFDMLAISGGAAGGAYGAGALVGLTQAGRRPAFAIVTGVSTGALIAPYAFLGPSWDDKLTEAYAGGHAEASFSLPALALTMEGALLGSNALERLVEPFVDERLLQAVAAEHRLGRRLLVATTDLDRQRPSIWDMGEIATRGGEAAVRMFRTILIASASVPGIFAPRLIRCVAEGEAFEELHVDGGVTAPLFLMPEALLRWRNLGRRLRGGKVYVLLNTVIDPEPRTTALTLPAILVRSFDTMLRQSYRQALNVVAAFCVAQDIPLGVAAIPSAPGRTERGAMLNFQTESMRALFEAGRKAAQEDEFWRHPATRQEPWDAFLERLRP